MVEPCHATGKETTSMNSKVKKTLKMHAMKIGYVIAIVAMFVLCWDMAYAELVHDAVKMNLQLLFFVVYAATAIVLGRVYHAYDAGRYRVSEVIYSQALSLLLSGGFTWLLMAIACMTIPAVFPMVALFVVQMIFGALWSLTANRLYFSMYKPKKTAIVYRRDSDLRKLQEIKYFDNKFEVGKYIKNPEDDIHALIRELEGFEAVFVAGVHATLRNGIAKYCVTEGVQGYFVPHVGDIILSGAKHMQMFSVPVLRIRRAAPKPEYLFVKRAFDVIASLIGIIVASPFMLATAAAIKLYDHGPVFYRQIRLTKDGRQFAILKFRSMKVNAEKDGVARLASENDDRITPVGKVIRACRLDELPQLINILKGDMTIVGPRPERPEIAAQYEKDMPAFNLRLQVKAGLTGLAQVYGRYNTEPYDKLQMDLMYINEMSIVTDLKLIFATVKILFMKESTSGIGEGQTTAKVDGEKVQEREGA